MVRSAVDVRIRGLERLMKKLERFPGAVQRKVVRPAVSAAASPVVSAAKQNLPRSRRGKNSGLLRKSIGKKIYTGRRTGTLAAYVGSRDTVKGFFGSGGRKPRKYWPVLYAHLVERGTIRSVAKPFMLPAWNRTRGRVDRIVRGYLRRGIAREAAKR